MLKTVVCDDERPALELMSELLVESGYVEIVAACLTPLEAIANINAGGIDLAVMDVEMPGMSGVDAFSQITVSPKPLLLFATAHPEYAVEAFGIDAIDYILKPFDRHRVHKAVERALRFHRLIAESEREDEADPASARDAGPQAALRIRDGGRIFVIPYAEVIWIEAAGDYSLIHSTGREAVIRKTISSLESELPAERFVRVHRSAIICRDHVKEVRLLTKGEAILTLTGDATVRSSRSFKAAVTGLAPQK
ncbi:LytR/AlgR family response regulator transcription factor [Hyphomonas sp.]|uniref:LytR/AlgR family response regulator transcription factor n=1 Tax=Hyphomonas sp. TaxID=87 RepID=UPI00391CB155